MERVERVESVESVERVESVESVERVESVDRLERVHNSVKSSLFESSGREYTTRECDWTSGRPPALRICSRPSRVGGTTVILRSKRPARTSASS